MSLTTNVLITGAGPTGLMMAAQLKRFGVDCILIDKKETTTLESRALGVQARSMEIYEQMGIVEKALERGERLHKVSMIVNGKLVQQVMLGEIGQSLSNYPYMFVLEQNKNEQLLLEHLQKLGMQVHWKHELISIREQKDGVEATCKNGDDEVVIHAKLFVAADGASSITRHLLNLKFDGGTYENVFYVADTAAQWPWGHDGLSLCLSANAFMGLFPMQGENRFRLIGMLPPGTDPDIHSFEEIEEKVKKMSCIDTDFYDTKWFSVYKVHHRSVRHFNHNRIFFAGDAAHVHSPAGGQGMNTGLQDAYNLGWKMAYALAVHNPKLLDTYEEERKPVATRLLRTTDRAFTFASSQKTFPKFMRMRVIPRLVGYLLRFKRFRLFMFLTISQTGIHYRKSFLSHTTKQSAVLEAGNLIPPCNINGRQIYDWLKFDGFTFFSFNWNFNEAQKEELKERVALPVQFIELKKTGNEEAYKKFKVIARAVFIIRPDNYIAFASDNITMDEVREYFTSCYHSQ